MGLKMTSWESYIRSLLLVAQSGICPICDKQIQEGIIEHNHENGAIRGLVHKPCNNKITQIETHTKKINYIISRREEEKIKLYPTNPIKLMIKMPLKPIEVET